MGDSMLSTASIRTLDLYGFDKNCDPCSRREEAKEVVGYCQDCEEYLCDACFQVHCIPTPSANHTTEYLTTNHSRRSGLPWIKVQGSTTNACTDTCTDLCPEHEGQIIEFYCKSRKSSCLLHKTRFGCKLCIKDRKICSDALYIPDESKKLDSNEVSKITEKLNASAQSLEQMFTNAQENKNLTEQNHQKVIKQARQFIEELKDGIGMMEEEFTQIAITKRDENLECLSKVAVKYGDASTQCMEICSIMEALQNNNQNCQLFIYMKKAEAMMQSLEKSLNEIQSDNRTTLFKFKPNRNLLAADSSLGSLEEKECVGHWSTLTNKHEAVLIRSGKDKHTRVARSKSRRAKGRASEAFDNQTALDVIQESGEIADT